MLARGAADPDQLFKYGLLIMIPLLTAKGFRFRETAVPLRNRIAGESKFFQDGRPLGGWKNVKDIAFNSGMMLGLLASLFSTVTMREKIFITLCEPGEMVFVDSYEARGWRLDGWP